MTMFKNLPDKIKDHIMAKKPSDRVKALTPRKVKKWPDKSITFKVGERYIYQDKLWEVKEEYKGKDFQIDKFNSIYRDSKSLRRMKLKL